MAIEKEKLAARAAHPREISMVQTSRRFSLPKLTASMTPKRPLATMNRSTLSVPDRITQAREQQQGYPQVRVIVLNDDVNTFQHVVAVLVRYIPGMSADQAWKLAYEVDGQGSAVVWCGPQEQGELYHQQLAAEGLTMAPLDMG